MALQAKELMVGDWVLHETGKYIRVGLPITERGFEYQCRYVEYFWLKPIPLTEEILKANGLIKVQGQLYVLNKHLYLCVVKGEYYITNVFNNIFAQIYYVHELQHALHLCGLNDLADNFKIE